MPLKKKTAAAFRPLRRADILSCEAIVRQSLPWKRLREGIDFVRLLRSGQTAIKACVCTVGGEIAGFVLFSPEPVFARGGYLRAIAVAPAMRNRDIGSRLLALAERRTAAHSPNMYLCVSSFNRSAQMFYQKLGYCRVGSVPGLILPKTAEHIYWKRLKPPR